MEWNQRIDHTLLKADATKEEIMQLCEEAKTYQFASVCVNSYWAPLCAKLLAASKVSVCTVIGFPLGAMSSYAKAMETKDAIEHGAEEIDMVINIGALKDHDYDTVEKDIAMVVNAAKGRCVKVILETCLLSKEEIIAACKICMKCNVDYVKTSTGFSKAGASVETVAWMKTIVGDQCKIKAAGGIRTYADMIQMIQAGADRIGTSNGVQLMQKQ